MSSDPWLLIIAFKTQTAAQHARKVIGETFEQGAVVAKRSEARGVLGEANPDAGMYNKAALIEPVYNPYTKRWETPNA